MLWRGKSLDTLVGLVGLVGTVMLALAVSPRVAEAKPGHEAFAVLPFLVMDQSKRKTAATIYRAVSDALRTEVKRRKLHWVEPRAFKKRARTTPFAAARGCGADASCLADLGRKIGARFIIAGTLTPIDNQLDALLIRVDSNERTIDKTVSVLFADVSKAAEAIAPHMVSLIDVAPTAPMVADEPDLVALIAPPVPGAGALEVGKNLNTPERPNTPEDPQIPAGSRTARAPDPELDDKVLAEPLDQDERNDPSTVRVATGSRKRGSLFWTGVAGLGVGAVAGAVALTFGLQSEQLRDDKERDEMTQIEWSDQVDDANAKARIANIAFVVAGAAGLAGLSLLAYDLFVAEPNVGVAILPTADGATAVMEVAW